MEDRSAAAMSVLADCHMQLYLLFIGYPGDTLYSGFHET